MSQVFFRRLPVLLVALLLSMAAQAWELSGSKRIRALTRDQQHIDIGHVDFQPLPDGRSAFTLHMDSSRWVDHFLSMKEFKCLQGPDEVLCHVPYPYKNPATVGPGDYAWLEHQLLFLFKQPRDFGAKLWNGLYYRLEPGEDGLVGRPQAMDLNLISAPPDDLLSPPYGAAQRDDVAPGAHWIERLLIH
jgi:hypothetical protein